MEIGNIVSCLSPRRIINPYTKELMYVKCRCCEPCLNSYSKQWQDRISNECKLHRYSLFLTLTYDNDHLPIFEPFFDDGVCKVWKSNREFDSDKFLKASDCGDGIPVSNSDLVCVAYVCREDIKLFFKRLRSNIDYEYKKLPFKEACGSRFRYFLCSEYGPRTFRPHYHAILWFESEWLLSNFERLLSKSWSFGSHKFELVNSNAPEYVAKYVAGNTRLPAVLCTEFTRTFHLQSKKPCIGFGSSDKEALFRNVLDGTYGRVELDARSQSPVFVPTSHSLEMSLLPKCKGYKSLSHFEKLRVYSAAFDFVREHGYVGLTPFLHEFFSCSGNKVPYCVCDVHCSLACLKWCDKFCTTPEIYLKGLEDYYSRKELYLLSCEYNYMIEYVDRLHLPLRHCVEFDQTCFEQLPDLRESFLRSPVHYWFWSFGVKTDDLYSRTHLKREILYKYHQKGTDFYESNVSKARKVFDDSLKNKKVNELLYPEQLDGSSVPKTFSLL